MLSEERGVWKTAICLDCKITLKDDPPKEGKPLVGSLSAYFTTNKAGVI